MIRSIMIPTDGSNRSLQAVPYAVEIARASGARLTLVQVHPHLPIASVPGAPGLYGDGFDKASFELEEEALKEIAVHIETESDLPVQFALLRGNAVHQLLEYARANEVELIVMSTHGRTGFSRAWLGSTADELVRTSHLPVLLRRVTRRRPRPGEGRIKRILIPLDGTAESESMLRFAADIGQLTGASYTLLRVHQPLGSFGMASLLADPGYEEAVRARLESYLEHAAELLPPGSAVDIRALTDISPAHVILRLAKEADADIVAIATKGRKGFARFALGSVADKVVRGSDRPLLIYSTKPVEAA
jgi:nucleotide-binding universal stress UspA family protein